ncbi:DUF4280 domain-containing protein [Velocimicrobium porci]|uniref:DUF4280 domain-containing protein n=1 Tax=Velocimicrobium porci TaxID=2606634 RepID=A0A6L5Y4I6_9FIRM|nr:DUF4280 domain-containing protein [Velocimicrobium porci]MSS65033.1 DUF4280 domain-containing protein [Velocimicrobium porci]
MGASYVVEGAEISCTMGEITGKLKVVPPHGVKLKSGNRASIADCKPLVNIPSFGICKTTQMPCIPACAMWVNGKSSVLIENFPALLSNSIAICPAGAGVIKIEDDGQ